MNKVPKSLTAVPSPLKELSLCIALALPALAFAQQTAGVLPEVKVGTQVPVETTEGTGSYTTGKARTATPLSLGLRDTPQSVSVVTQQRIADQGFQTITDVVNNVTGVSVNQYETHRGQFTARGFNINTLLIDGVPTTWDQAWSSGEILTSLAMYDRVEVVRGATGLTSGSGDPSAAINLVRKRAASKELKGVVELDIGTWNQQRALLDLATPLNESGTVRARLVGETGQRDSWVTNLHNKNQTLFATVEADLGSNTLLSAGISRQENDPRGSMWGGLPVWYSDGTRTHWDRSKTSAADWTHWNSVTTNYFAALEHRLDNGWQLKANYNRGERDADSYLLYLMGAPNRTTGAGMVTWPGSYQVRTTQDDVGLQAVGPFQMLGRKHELAVGYVHSRQNFNADSRAAPMGAISDFNTWNGTSYAEPAWGPLSYYGMGTVTQDALYSAARFNVSDPLRLIVGARLTNYQRSGDDAFTNPFTMTFNRQLTPYAGIVYDLSDSLSAYASYTDIFQPQKERELNGRYLDPILGKSMETGIKGEFLDGRLNASAAVFRIQQQNLAQSLGTNIPGTVPPETAYRPSRGATSHGFELELAGELARGWNMSAGYTQFKATDAAGADVNSIYPRKLLKLFTTYRLPGAWSAVTLGGGVNWEGTTYTYATNPLGASERIEQKAYALVQLMARYEFSPQLSLQLNINNVFDKTHYAMFDAYSQFTYGAPRNATLSLKYKF